MDSELYISLTADFRRLTQMDAEANALSAWRMAQRAGREQQEE